MINNKIGGHKLMTRGGVAQGFVWLGDKIGLSGGGFVAFTFIATCVIATATGTSIGTMFTAFPILYPSGLLLGADPVFLAGAILSGAIFGDNVGPISDTTIASASTQEYTNKPGVADVAGVVGSRMKYALVAAAAATVCFALFGGSGSAINAAEAEAILAQYSNPKGLIMLIPVVILLVVAFIKRNIYIACTWGLISGTVIGLVSGILVPSDVLGLQDGTLGGFLIDGVNNMIGTVGYLYAIAGIIGILSASGLLQQVIDGLVHSKLSRSVVGTDTPEHPILIDQFLENAIEVDVDALADGKDVYVAGVMEHIEEAGIHSGDSACVLPPYSLSDHSVDEITRQTVAHPRSLNNSQCARGGPHEHSVRRQGRHGVHSGGEPPRLAHRALCVQGHGRASAPPGHPDHAGQDASGAGPLVHAQGRLRIGEGSGVPLQALPGRGHSARPRNAFHRRGHGHRLQL